MLSPGWSPPLFFSCTAGGRRSKWLTKAAGAPAALAGEVEEGNQALPVGGKRLHRLGVLGLILRLEASPGGLAVGAALGVHHLVQRAFGAPLKALGQLVEHVGKLVAPAALRAGLGPHFARRGPEPQRAVAHRYYRRDHPAPFEIAQ